MTLPSVAASAAIRRIATRIAAISARNSSSSSSSKTTTKITSIGFSGAGFLLCYHLGVAKCLLEHTTGWILRKGEFPRASANPNSNGNDTGLPLTGVSGGALVAAALCAGVDPDMGMQTALEVNQETRKAGVLDSLQPGFSLIDIVHNKFSVLLNEAVDYDSDYMMRRIDHGRLLRIGLTDRRLFRPFLGEKGRQLASIHVERFRDMDDVIAACILSSYIPGFTGPAGGSLDMRHSTLSKAGERVKELINAGCVVRSSTGEPIERVPSENHVEREICWDGGLVNAFPWFDDHTLIVAPLAADFAPNPSITPAIAYKPTDRLPKQLQVNSRAKINLTAANLTLLPIIVFSSEDSVLEAKFKEGYDHAFQFLQQNR